MDSKNESSEASNLAVKLSEKAENFKRIISSWVTDLSPILRSLPCSESSTTATPSENLLHTQQLQDRISSLERQIKKNDTVLRELASSRDESLLNEKKAFRTLFRLCAGRLSLEDVKKDIEKDPLYVADEETIKPDLVVSSSTTVSLSSGEAVATPERDGERVADGAAAAAAAAAAVSVELRRKVCDLEAIAECRDGRIAELLKEREAHQKHVNSLLPTTTTSTAIAESDILQSKIYLDLESELVLSRRDNETLKDKINLITKQWQESKGEVNLLNKAMEEMQEKHEKRWTELGQSSIYEPIKLSKEKIELEHKLQQALEAASHAQSLTTSLSESRKMNETLEHKVTELKAKYMAATSSKPRGESSHRSSSGGSSGDRTSSSRGDTSYDRLKADFRKVRKELAAANLSKENYKGKLERSEKERESVTKANKRLLQQSSEKEEMNAKSLSQILHLKQMSELRTQEIEVLKKKVKHAEQVALAARLVANAKKRVDEEIEKHKQEADIQNTKLRQSLDQLHTQKHRVDTLLSAHKTQITSLTNDLLTVKRRSDELATESIVAKWDISEANQQAAKASISSSIDKRVCGTAAGGEFTNEQLSTHLSVLKGRLACPVCNHREKQCILLRCRHMFCKHCIDVKIKNRSRKCPACAQRFDMKDVQDVWL